MGETSQRLCSERRFSLTNTPVPREAMHATKKEAPNHTEAFRYMGAAILAAARGLGPFFYQVVLSPCRIELILEPSLAFHGDDLSQAT